jgi:hypothetical protein
MTTLILFAIFACVTIIVKNKRDLIVFIGSFAVLVSLITQLLQMLYKATVADTNIFTWLIAVIISYLIVDMAIMPKLSVAITHLFSRGISMRKFIVLMCLIAAYLVVSNMDFQDMQWSNEIRQERGKETIQT